MHGLLGCCPREIDARGERPSSPGIRPDCETVHSWQARRRRRAYTPAWRQYFLPHCTADSLELSVGISPVQFEHISFEPQPRTVLPHCPLHRLRFRLRATSFPFRVRPPLTPDIYRPCSCERPLRRLSHPVALYVLPRLAAPAQDPMHNTMASPFASASPAILALSDVTSHPVREYEYKCAPDRRVRAMHQPGPRRM